jgi:hypothetical protein
MKADATAWMRANLGLTISPEKTHITHGRKRLRFLGYELQVCVNQNGTRWLRLSVPREAISNVVAKVEQATTYPQAPEYDVFSSVMSTPWSVDGRTTTAMPMTTTPSAVSCHRWSSGGLCTTSARSTGSPSPRPCMGTMAETLQRAVRRSLSTSPAGRHRPRVATSSGTNPLDASASGHQEREQCRIHKPLCIPAGQRDTAKHSGRACGPPLAGSARSAASAASS